MERENQRFNKKQKTKKERNKKPKSKWEQFSERNKFSKLKQDF